MSQVQNDPSPHAASENEEPSEESTSAHRITSNDEIPDRKSTDEDIRTSNVSTDVCVSSADIKVCEADISQHLDVLNEAFKAVEGASEECCDQTLTLENVPEKTTVAVDIVVPTLWQLCSAHLCVAYDGNIGTVKKVYAYVSSLKKQCVSDTGKSEISECDPPEVSCSQVLDDESKPEQSIDVADISQQNNNLSVEPLSEGDELNDEDLNKSFKSCTTYDSNIEFSDNDCDSDDSSITKSSDTGESKPKLANNANESFRDTPESNKNDALKTTTLCEDGEISRSTHLAQCESFVDVVTVPSSKYSTNDICTDKVRKPTSPEVIDISHNTTEDKYGYKDETMEEATGSQIHGNSGKHILFNFVIYITLIIDNVDAITTYTSFLLKRSWIRNF